MQNALLRYYSSFMFSRYCHQHNYKLQQFLKGNFAIFITWFHRNRQCIFVFWYFNMLSKLTVLQCKIAIVMVLNPRSAFVHNNIDICTYIMIFVFEPCLRPRTKFLLIFVDGKEITFWLSTFWWRLHKIYSMSWELILTLYFLIIG